MQGPSSAYRTLKDVPRPDNLRPGSPLCPGCGGEISLRLALKALGARTIVVHVPGCFGPLSLYPYAAITNSMLFSPFASAPAVAQGLVDGIQSRVAKGRLEDPGSKVLVLTGDGAAYDIGLQSTSGAIHRGLDFYYLCYDNEANGNTGFQYSSSTPYGSWTSTTQAKGTTFGNDLRKKDLFEIWRAHKPPYAATLAVSRPVDFLKKFEKATKIAGPRLFVAMSVCPTGWGSSPSETVKVDRLAVESGLWPLKEAIDGVVTHTYVPRKRIPVRDYLQKQRRYDHLFRPKENAEVLKRIQDDVDAYWAGIAP